MNPFMASWFPNIVSFAAGAVVTWIVSRYYYITQRRENAPMVQALVDVRRKLETGAMTTDQAAQDIIKALETGALKPADFSLWEWTYKFCPECKSEVELVGSWSADEYNAFGGTMKCKKCSWGRKFSY